MRRRTRAMALFLAGAGLVWAGCASDNQEVTAEGRPDGTNPTVNPGPPQLAAHTATLEISAPLASPDSTGRLAVVETLEIDYRSVDHWDARAPERGLRFEQRRGRFLVYEVEVLDLTALPEDVRAAHLEGFLELSLDEQKRVLSDLEEAGVATRVPERLVDEVETAQPFVPHDIYYALGSTSSTRHRSITCPENAAVSSCQSGEEVEFSVSRSADGAFDEGIIEIEDSAGRGSVRVIQASAWDEHP